MPVTSADGHGAVTEKVRDLVEALRATPIVERFRAADEQFRTDAEVVRMQVDLRASYEQTAQAEREKRHDPRLFDEVRAAQVQFQRHPRVVELAEARTAAEGLLREINGAMTAILGVDVGASAGRRAGGCC